MWRGSVSYNDLIAELRNTWMKKPYNPKSRLYSLCSGVSYHGMWANFPVSPEDWHCSSCQACASSPLWLHYEGTPPTGGMGGRAPSLVTGVLTEPLLQGNSMWTNVWCWNRTWSPTVELLKPAESCSQQHPHSLLRKSWIQHVSV